MNDKIKETLEMMENKYEVSNSFAFCELLQDSIEYIKARKETIADDIPNEDEANKAKLATAYDKIISSLSEANNAMDTVIDIVHADMFD